MKTKLSWVLCALAGGVLMFPAEGFGESPSREQIAALVDKAAALVERDSEKAFAQFRKKGSEWFRGETYIFVDDMDGNCLCHPAQPKLQGTNLLELKDANGKLFVREMIDLLKSRESGWVEYAWPKAGQSKPSRKASFVRKVKRGDKMVLVGSGLYLD